MKYTKMSLVSAVSIALAACGSTKNPSAEQSPASSDKGTMSMAPASGTVQHGKGTGTVTAIDAKAGTITLDHGPIPEVSWPAMTMAFKAAPDVIGKASVGDKVEFEVHVNGNASEITALKKE